MFFEIPEMPSKTSVMVFKKLPDHFKGNETLAGSNQPELRASNYYFKICLSIYKVDLLHGTVFSYAFLMFWIPVASTVDFML